MTVYDVAHSLPDLPRLRDLCRAMAMVEAVIDPGGTGYHAFDAAWSPTAQLASMDNGAGDAYDIVFCPAGAYVRGFDHESPMSPYVTGGIWPGVLDAVPPVFQEYVTEPSFALDGLPHVTVCLWREAGDDRWSAGDVDFSGVPGGHADPDGADWLFQALTDPGPERFADFARGYYERPVDLDAVRRIFALRPLDGRTVRALNTTVPLTTVAARAAAIGYPTALDPAA